ncbi:hypothetical protein [Rhizobacter sp. SG703]|uniref:hypothetical protein n=1 Tax=Rhizobacter sp. SG703 TaxID=2587140 RepID=UPI001445B2BB|nr:hypothetical protein [Rhizobacter sp. SG703]NKI93048.1 hypothetical protein [Rhizobacter sp. SG703]
MRAAGRLLCLIAFVSLLSQFGKTLLSMAHVPNLIPPLRDGLLLLLVLFAISRTDVFKARGFYLWALLCIASISATVFVAAFDDRHVPGLYYARIYLLPLLFAVALEGIVLRASDDDVRALLRMSFWCGLLVVFTAFGIFAAVELSPRLLRTLMGDDTGTGPLASAWYIAGGTWLRMGLPATGPNSLGLALGLYALLVGGVLFSRKPRPLPSVVVVAALVFALLAVALTFSRSSWLAIMLGTAALVLACVPGSVLFSPANLTRMVLAGAVSIALMGVALLLLDSYSDGAVTRWALLNASGTDPSMVGHHKSFVMAIESLNDYAWLGYPKGTVGARAALFGGTLYNVENSFLALFFDMGLPIGTVFLVSIAGMLSGLWVHRSQWSVLIGFTVCAFFLPYNFEPDIVVFFLFVFTLLGRFMHGHAAAFAPPRAPSLYQSTLATHELA